MRSIWCNGCSLITLGTRVIIFTDICCISTCICNSASLLLFNRFSPPYGNVLENIPTTSLLPVFPWEYFLQLSCDNRILHTYRLLILWHCGFIMIFYWFFYQLFSVFGNFSMCSDTEMSWMIILKLQYQSVILSTVVSELTCTLLSTCCLSVQIYFTSILAYRVGQL